MYTEQQVKEMLRMKQQECIDVLLYGVDYEINGAQTYSQATKWALEYKAMIIRSLPIKLPDHKD